MAALGRAMLFFLNWMPWGDMDVMAVHKPFSESGSSTPTKLEDAIGACAIAALGTSEARRRPPRKQPVIRLSPSRSTRFMWPPVPLSGCVATRLPDLEEDARRIGNNADGRFHSCLTGIRRTPERRLRASR
jgi:hypothetical protein